MSGHPYSVSETDLQAYVDERLEPARQDRVAAAIASQPELARRVNELRSLCDAMHVAYDSVLEEAVPTEMLRTVLGRRRGPLPRLAAAVAWMTIGGIIGALAVDQWPSNQTAETALVRSLPQAAAYAYAVYVPEVRHPVEVGANQRAHLNAWLSKRLAHPVSAPDVRRMGYQLVGGRLLPDAGRPAALFMYEDTHGARLTLYVRTHREQTAATALRHAESDGFGVVYWIDGPLAYALTGRIARPALERVAEAMYAALNP